LLDCHLVPAIDLSAEMGDHGAVIVVTSKEQWDKILAENSDAAVVVSQEMRVCLLRRCASGCQAFKEKLYA
jgi:hypothetical protein